MNIIYHPETSSILARCGSRPRSKTFGWTGFFPGRVVLKASFLQRQYLAQSAASLFCFFLRLWWTSWPKSFIRSGRLWKPFWSYRTSFYHLLHQKLLVGLKVLWEQKLPRLQLERKLPLVLLQQKPPVTAPLDQTWHEL